MNSEFDSRTSRNEIKLSESTKIEMTTLCTICLDKSSGFHYGTQSCEGCKGFFRRMVTNSNLSMLLLQCTGYVKNRCEINIITRNNCQRCRLQKCFQMGMTRNKTRLGRRTKDFVLKLHKVFPRLVDSFISDEDMVKLIKLEISYFHNNESTENSTSNIKEEEEIEAKCVKNKAKLYSERKLKMNESNCLIYHPHFQLNVTCENIKEIDNINREDKCFVAKIKMNSEKTQLEKIFHKIRLFRNKSLNLEEYLYFGNCKTKVFNLINYYNHPNIEEMEEFYRTGVDKVRYIYNPLHVFTEIIFDISQVMKRIFIFLKSLPDMELFDISMVEKSDFWKRKMIQTLYIWLIRFVNVSENVMYNNKLTMKFPNTVLIKTPLKKFFKFLFQFVKICNSALTMEMDDFEVSLIIALMITFSNNNGLISFYEPMLQSDNIVNARFVYFESLYDHIFTERCVQNHDLRLKQRLYGYVLAHPAFNAINTFKEYYSLMNFI